MRGNWKCSQSADASCRTIIALVKAAKDMEMADTATHMPVSDFCACAPTLDGLANEMERWPRGDQPRFPALLLLA